MAVDTYLVGNDGNVAYGFGTGGTNTGTFFKVRSFAATLNRNVSELTAFGDSGKRKRLGMLDLTGTLNAIIGVDISASATTTNTQLVLISTQDTTSTRPAVTLTFYDGSTNDAKISSNAVFSSFAFNSDKGGDQTMTVNFENADGVAPVVTWLL